MRASCPRSRSPTAAAPTPAAWSGSRSCERARNYGDAPDLDRIAANAERIAEKVAGAKSLLAEEPA
jgi:hypothetical protein